MADDIIRSAHRDHPTNQGGRGWRHLTPESLSALLLVDRIPFFGPNKFRLLYQRGLSPQDLVDEPDSASSLGGSRGAGFASHLSTLVNQRSEFEAQASKLLKQAEKLGAAVISYADPSYPQVLLRSNYPVPVLFVRGSDDVLRERNTVACVGSRNIRPPYSDLHDRFARTAASHGTVVVSGFALGADSIGHRAAVAAGGKTVGVMAGGVAQPFPPENRALWDQLLPSGKAVFVSESPFDRRADALTLRRRNKLIVALSLGVLVSQSAADGGAMNAYRFGLEGHKPVATFAADSTGDTSGNWQIANDPKSGGPVFGQQASHQEFHEWLRELASST